MWQMAITDEVQVIDTATNTITTTVSVGSGSDHARCIAVHPDGSTLYVSGENIVSVIDTATYTVTKTIEIGESAWGIAVHPDGATVYVAHDPNTVSIIDTSTNSVISTITVGSSPMAFGMFIGPAVPKPICKCDFPPADGDIDGFDLAAYKANNAGISLSEFAEEFGRINCQ